MHTSLTVLTSMLAVLTVAACSNEAVPGDAPDALSAQAAEEPNDAEVQERSDVTAPPPAGNSVPTELTVTASEERNPSSSQTLFDPMNSSFSLDGKTVVLKNGVSRVAAAPGSASIMSTRYLGKPTQGDLNADGREDVAYFVTRSTGGSGDFYYVVVALNGKNGFRNTNAFFVGDRINPQSLRIGTNKLQVRFLGRPKGEPLTTPPSHPVALFLKVTPEGVLEGLMK